MALGSVSWPLGNGEVLNFEVYDSTVGWNDVPGLYIFAYEMVNGWHALYVGKAESFLKRLPNHERLNEAARMGATHIHALVVRQQSLREEWERRLIETLKPPLNMHHKNPLNI